ncbi:TspO/MBR family protein [Sphingomonas sp.]|uniref:TspO/MBR family protein n=1 Tax=Sphingomonas sp. TaxID=28214 RepID=UPI001DE38AB9|nr:TspO/MBR family protein [Sphingomonas sp.]MBX9796853.1 tryptophan-rich sensory protein [Sphingomonas sp.]
MAFLRTAVVTVPAILLLGFLSANSVAVGSVNRWYAMLVKPALTPPDWVFPIAWTVLYVAMGLALAMVINARGSAWRGVAIALFAAQLAVNLAWTPLFFGAHQLFWALILLVLMFALAAAATFFFARVRVAAALLMLPYLGWILFAGMLNYQINALNPNAETLVPTAGSAQIPL